MTRRNSRNSRRRRGVLLLIVLGLLAVFCLIGLMFVLTSAQQRRGAVSGQKFDQVRDPAPQQLNQAFAQVMRGTKEPAVNYYRTTGIGAHSLLEGMYGNNAKVGAVVTGMVTQPGNKQLIQIGIADPTATSTNGYCDASLLPIQVVDTTRLPTGFTSTSLQGPFNPANPTLGAFQRQCSQCVGCVLTFLNGPAAGCSTRIVSYNSTGATFLIAATDEITYMSLSTWLARYGSVDSLKYVVNGVPFSGVGFGFNPTTFGVDGLTDQVGNVGGGGGDPIALLPNLCDPRTDQRRRHSPQGR